MFRKLTYLILLSVVSLTVQGRQQLTEEGRKAFHKQQDSLVKLSEAIFQTEDDFEKIVRNTAFVKQLTQCLQLKFSFRYSFDSLKRVSILQPSDLSFRIFSWFVPLSDGTFRYYGAIQLPTTDGSLRLFPLSDATAQTTDFNAITGPKQWIGARYYEIIPMIYNGRLPYFILLGWKGHSAKSTKKIIDVLSFQDGNPVFGKAVFENRKEQALQNRVVFEYTRQHTMTLTYDRKVQMIVFDHLVPIDPEMTGRYEYYAGDSSFDAYKINYSKLSLVENVPLKNPPSAQDEQYIAPIKASERMRNRPQ